MAEAAIRPDAVAWLVRGGKKAAHIDTLIRRETAAVSWATVIGDTDLRTIDDDAILKAAARAGRRDPQEDLRELRGFQRDIVDGDVVVMPDSPRGDVVIGVTAGPYEFPSSPVAGDLRHCRAARWLGRYGRELLPEDVRERMDRHHRTVWRLPDQLVWLSVVAEVVDGRGQPPEKSALAETRASLNGRSTATVYAADADS